MFYNSYFIFALFFATTWNFAVPQGNGGLSEEVCRSTAGLPGYLSNITGLITPLQTVLSKYKLLKIH